jgi:hypothetical protein
MSETVMFREDKSCGCKIEPAYRDSIIPILKKLRDESQAHPQGINYFQQCMKSKLTGKSGNRADVMRRFRVAAIECAGRTGSADHYDAVNVVYYNQMIEYLQNCKEIKCGY